MNKKYPVWGTFTLTGDGKLIQLRGLRCMLFVLCFRFYQLMDSASLPHRGVMQKGNGKPDY